MDIPAVSEVRWKALLRFLNAEEIECPHENTDWNETHCLDCDGWRRFGDREIESMPLIRKRQS